MAHYIWTELIKNLFVNVATLCTPVSCTCQLGQIRVAGSILHGQVCNLPDHGGRKNALDHKCRSLLAKPDWESSGLSRPGAFSKACRFLPDSISICQPLSLLGFSKPIGFSKPQGFSKPLLEIKNKFILSQNLSEARCFWSPPACYLPFIQDHLLTPATLLLTLCSTCPPTHCFLSGALKSIQNW